MRTLVVVCSALHVRDFVTAGAFDALPEQDTWFLGGPDLTESHVEVDAADLERFTSHPNYLGSLKAPRERWAAYRRMRRLLLTHYRRRSRTQKIKFAQKSRRSQWRNRLAAAPGWRQLQMRRLLRETGLHPELHRIMEELRPDVVVGTSGGVDWIVYDVIRSARALGIPSLALMYNWDNLSSKAVFPVPPDHVGVAGEQAVRDAESIHRIPRDHVWVLGSPYIDGHYRHELGSTESPFSFPYVVFAGCYQPFDELDALQRLEREIEARGLDLKVVYRPHPRRLPRQRPDFVDEEQFRHVVIDPQVRDGYLNWWREWESGVSRPKMHVPSLDYYPRLLENAEFVICPLSTLMIEAAIFERRVLVIGYHDGLHKSSPGIAIKYLHFEGVEDVDGFAVCHDAERFAPMFAEMATDTTPPARSLREQSHYWIDYDGRTYSERLAEAVERISSASPPPPRAPAAGAPAPQHSAAAR